MKRSESPVFARTLCSLAAAGLLALPVLPARAQDTKPAAPKPAASATSGQPAKPAPAAKPAQSAAIKTPQERRKAAGVPEPTSAQEMAALPPADDAQKSAAELVHYGQYVCDEKFEVFVERNKIVAGYVDVRYKKDVWVMKPVASNTGAVRLEDTRGKVLLVQIPFKSMLLNTQTGQRIVDSCQHDVQIGAQKEAASAPKTDGPMLR
jgi:hypothetical protein